MKNLQKAKVGDLMFDIKDNVELRIADIEGDIITCENLDGFGGRNYTTNGSRLNSIPLIRVLFYLGQIAENKYLGLSADGVKMFYGMKVFSFHLASENRDITEFMARNCDKLKEHNVYSAAYSTKEAAEKAQKKHFEPETFPLPWWLTVLELDKCPSVRVGSLPFRFSAYGNGWGKVPTDSTEVTPANFIKAQFSELKDGDFFTLGADTDHILLRIHNKHYIRITNEGEVRNQNLGKLGEVFKVVTKDIKQESKPYEPIEARYLRGGDRFKSGTSNFTVDFVDIRMCRAIKEDGEAVIFSLREKVYKI